MANEYPKTMQSKTGQTVVVANEEQEIALPSDFGGKAKGKSYADTAAATARDPLTPEERAAPLTQDEKREAETLERTAERQERTDANKRR